MTWGMANRPKVSNKLGIPTPREGNDGDIQVRQTNLGVKLFGKLGGRWNSTFLSKEDEIIGTSGTKIGMDSSGTFNVNNISLSGKISLSSTGTQNVCIGKNNADKGEDNIAIGVNAGASYNFETLQNIAIGTHSLEDTTDSGGGGTDGSYNIALGYKSGWNVSNGSGNILIGLGAGATYTVGASAVGADLTAGTANICLGNFTGVDAADAIQRISIGRGIIGTTNYYARLGSSTYSATLNFSASGQSWSTTSDVRVKKDIVNSNLGLNFIKALRPIKYLDKNCHDWPDEIKPDPLDERKEDSTVVLDGLIAQEVKAVIDNQNVTFDGWEADPNTIQRLQYSKFVLPLIKAVQELSAKVDTMQTEINNLTSE